MKQGWVKLHRQLIEWEWYSDINTSRLFIHCLLRANHKDTKWRGQDIKRGQFITSLDTLSNETGLTISQIRTSLKKLKSTDEIASLSQARSRVITVVKYDCYQEDSKIINSKSQPDRKLIATDKNDKNDKNKNKVILTPDGINSPAWDEWIKFRKSKKKPVSQEAAKKQFKLLTDYDLNTQQQIINQSIQNDYQGLFEPKGGSNAKNTNNNRQDQNALVRAATNAGSTNPEDYWPRSEES